MFSGPKGGGFDPMPRLLPCSILSQSGGYTVITIMTATEIISREFLKQFQLGFDRRSGSGGGAWYPKDSFFCACVANKTCSDLLVLARAVISTNDILANCVFTSISTCLTLHNFSVELAPV